MRVVVRITEAAALRGLGIAELQQEARGNWPLELRKYS